MTTWPLPPTQLAAAYCERRQSPADVIERSLLLAEQAADAGHAFLIQADGEGARRSAAASAERYASGTPLGPLDGFPIAIKDEIDVAGLSTRYGTTYMPSCPVMSDAVAVKRLRDAGAVVIGKVHQHEFGLGVTGVGPQFPVPRNPHAPDRVPGGSSSGSAVGVASGIIPLSLGSDAGGSGRIPASLCGVFGFKPTYGRVPRTGDTGLNGSLGHMALIASSVAAIDHAMGVVSGKDPSDPATMHEAAPFESLGNAGMDLTGLTFGIDESMWRNAAPDVAKQAREVLRTLEGQGARLVDVAVRHGELTRQLGFLVLTAESAAQHRDDVRLYAANMGWDARAVLAFGARITASDYIHAQRVRHELRLDVARVLSSVKAIIMPTTLITAPPIHADATESGEVDDDVTRGLTTNTFLANLTGHPAISCPIGCDRDGLPIGLQIVGDAWDDAGVLQIAAWLEREQIARVLRPRVSYDLVTGAS